MVIGKAERLSTLEVMKYFHSRPRDSQIGAWVSKQSSRISARGILESKFLGAEAEVSTGRSAIAELFGAVFASALNRLSSGRVVSIACMTAFCTSVKMMRGRLIVLHPEKMQKSCFNRWYS